MMARTRGVSSSLLDESIVIACLIGLNLMTGFLIYESINEHFSSVYLVPETLETYPVGSTTSFVFGIRSYEKEQVQYCADIYAGPDHLGRKMFTLLPGETREVKQMIDLSTVSSIRPLLVSVRVGVPEKDYEVHYWIRNRTLTA